MRYALLVSAALAAAVSSTPPARGAEAPLRMAQNLTRSQIRSMPIEARPNRPIHIYGNAVRRRHHRSAAPAPAPLRPAR